MGLTQQALAEKVGCTPSYIGHIETGYRLPDRRTANAFARLFGIPQPRWDEFESADTGKLTDKTAAGEAC